MLKTLFKGGDDERQAAPGMAYAYRASLIGAAHRYVLTDEGLLWRTGRRHGVWPYADIVSVRLSYRPMGMQHRRYRADLRDVGGRRITIFSTSKQTAALMQPQSGYSTFIVNLHRRLAAVDSTARLRAGLGRGIYNSIMALLACVALAMAALLLRALFVGEFAGALFVVGFGALFGWQIGGFLRRNRPRRYTFDDVPKELLP